MKKIKPCPLLNRRQTMAVLFGAAVATARPSFAAETFNPPLWVVRSRGVEVYLFGEMFAAKDFGSSSRVVTAFNKSTEYWRETPPLNAQEWEAMLAEFGKAEMPLTELLGEADAKRLLMMAEAIKVRPEFFNWCRPWLAVQRLQGLVYQSLGVAFQQDAGVSKAAKTEVKRVKYEFANGSALVRYFADMPFDVEREYLLSLLWTFEAGREAWGRRPLAWAAGDISTEHSVMQRQAKDFPAYFRYITNRNEAWVPRIQTMLSSGTTSFLRVGFGHLVGPDSLLHYLEKAGLAVKRIA